MPTQNDNPGIQPINTTNYFHYRDPNLNRIENAMDYDALGQPVLRTTNKIGQSDAFGRLRISEPFTLGDYKHLYGLDNNFLDKIFNGGSVTFQANQACARLTTSNNVNSRVVHQTKFYHHYMPGKSQQILSSFNFYAANTNVTKRSGYYDDNNGIYFEQAGDGTLSWVIRSYVSGSPVENRKTQAQWNIDPCNGTGASTFVLDITKTQLIFIEFQWLGVGTVTVGFVHEGAFVPCHQFHHSNSLTTVYMSSPNLPVRCEILNTGATAGAFFDQICSTVLSEGGYVEAGIDWAVTNPTLKTVTAGATLPIIAIRLKTAFKTYANRMIVRMGNLNMFSDGESIKWRLLKLPDSTYLNDTNWVDVDDDSGVQYNVDATTWTDGDEMDSGWVGASTQGSQKAGGAPAANIPSAAKKNYIVQNYDSTDSEIYLIVATNLGSQSTQVGAAIQWREIY
jgi:hypothetical protein